MSHERIDERGASGTGWWDPASGAYAPDLLAAAGVDRHDLETCLPRVLAPTEAAGPIADAARTALGLPRYHGQRQGN